MRKRWKWIVLIAAVAVASAVALWLSSRGPTVNTTLRLTSKRPEIVKDPRDGKTDQPPVWCSEFLLHSDRLLEIVPTKYSIEAITPAGSTNYEAPFWVRKPSLFDSVGIMTSFGKPSPFLVFMPNDADAFRVKIEVNEFGFAYSRLQRWVSVGSGRQLDQRLRDLISNARQRGVVRTVWSPWLVKTNGRWVEQAER